MAELLEEMVYGRDRMTRRDFVAGIVGGIIAAANARKLQAIADHPVGHERIPHAVQFSTLMDAYNSCVWGKQTPDLLMVSKRVYQQILEAMRTQERWFAICPRPYEKESSHLLQFCGAGIQPSEYVPDDTVIIRTTTDPMNPHCNRIIKLRDMA